MSSKVLSTQFSTQYRSREPRLLIVRTNGGSLVVEKLVGANWVAADTFTADGAHLMQFGAGPVRFTPSNGAEYSIE
jgi:hypothetical protein